MKPSSSLAPSSAAPPARKEPTAGTIILMASRSPSPAAAFGAASPQLPPLAVNVTNSVLDQMQGQPDARQFTFQIINVVCALFKTLGVAALLCAAFANRTPALPGPAGKPPQPWN